MKIKMINMFNLNLSKNIGIHLYLLIYLIIPYSAITQTLKVDFIRNLENSLNKRDLEFIRKILEMMKTKIYQNSFQKLSMISLTANGKSKD